MLLAGYRHNQKNANENKAVSVILPTGLLSNTEREAEEKAVRCLFSSSFYFYFSVYLHQTTAILLSNSQKSSFVYL